MSSQTFGPFSCGGGPIGHPAPSAGVAAIAAAVPSMARRDIFLKSSSLFLSIVPPKVRFRPDLADRIAVPLAIFTALWCKIAAKITQIIPCGIIALTRAYASDDLGSAIA